MRAWSCSGVAQPAPRHVDDALEGEVVGRRSDAAQIGERVADLGALVEARAADHPVGQAEGDEAVLQLAHLERGADQDGDLVELVAGALQLLDLLADRARLLLRIPGAGHGDLLAQLVLGAQRLAEPALVVGDEVGGGREDMAGRAVIALEPDHGGAGEILLEAQDVVDLGATPAVDRLVVVADAAQVLRPLGEQPQPQILGDVRVLIFVDQHEPEALLILAQHLRVLAEQADGLEQEVAEVGGVEHFQPLLIGGVELEAASAGEDRGLAGRDLVGREPAVLPIVDHRRERAGGPALLVDVLGLQHLLHQADLIVHVEDGEIRLEADQLGVAAQELDPDGVKGAEPRHALDHLADHAADPFLHLARRLVGEGDGEDVRRPRAAEAQDVGDAGGEHARLAGAGAGKHQHRPVEALDREALLGIEPGQIGRIGARTRPRGNAPWRGRRRRIDAQKFAWLGHSSS